MLVASGEDMHELKAYGELYSQLPKFYFSALLKATLGESTLTKEQLCMPTYLASRFTNSSESITYFAECAEEYTEACKNHFKTTASNISNKTSRAMIS